MHEQEADGMDIEELRALAALPRERAPRDQLEDHVVRSLRQRGLLRPPGRPQLPRSWGMVAIAASLALFAAGTAFGQWLGVRQSSALVSAVAESDARAAALRVQSAGSEYLAALAALVQAAGNADAVEARQAREVALAVLRGASEEMERLEQASAARSGASQEVRHVVWF